MYILSSSHRSEFLAVPELIRIAIVRGENGDEVALLIKASSLNLKYLLRLRSFEVLIFRLSEGRIVYGVQIKDDPEKPILIWSTAESEDELHALQMLTGSPKCFAYLFNEIVVNVCWASLDIDISNQHLGSLVENSIVNWDDSENIAGEVSERVAEHRRLSFSHQDIVVGMVTVKEFIPIQSHYISNRADRSLISLLDLNEGRQQEELSLWLLDSLHPLGAVKSPQIEVGGRRRELSDLILSYSGGAFLFESKTLSILQRETLPDRDKLTRDISKHILKAIKQLSGGVRSLKLGKSVFDLEGREIEVERENPIHVVVIIPDLSLLDHSIDFGGVFFQKTAKEIGGFFHILDLAELLRIVQAAEMIVARGKSTNQMVAFDSYLLERFKLLLAAETPNVHVLIRF